REYESGSEKDSSSSTTRMRVMSVCLSRPVTGRRGRCGGGALCGAVRRGPPCPCGDGSGAAHLGQPQGEGRALARQGPGGDLSAVVARDVLDDRQAQPGAAGGPGAGAVDPEEALEDAFQVLLGDAQDRKSTRLNSSHVSISYAVFCLKKKNKTDERRTCSRSGRASRP